ncbi:response regulator transcription factor [Ensifer sp. 1H6]|uniref:response regulator transcription factor n=1 Tax=Ensifer sp. 1H6 TaxID=1911585 RepID=UPI0009CE2FD6|nr:response regulator transcription factor [Ensifer sp. 1H6]OMQ43743.1 hypothetical protein BKP54_17170 [Ensifer sp. 1H6]
MKRLVMISSRDAEFSLPVRHILRASGFSAHLATSREETLRMVRDDLADAVLLDGQLEAALELCEDLKRDEATRHVKIVALLKPSGAGRYADFLNAGIDEAFIRPVDPDTYVRAITRYVAPEETGSSSERGTKLNYGNVELDLTTRRVLHAGIPIRLAATEFEMLHRFLRTPTAVVTRQDLIASAWPKGVFVDPRTVNVHVARLRRALLMATGLNLIRTVRGIGYALEQN